MTNKEKYKQAFSVLHASDNLSQEVESMSRFQKRTKMKTAAAVIAGCVILGGTGTAYAANVGGIQRTIQLWIHGDQTSATMEISNDGSSSSYQIEYQDADGTTQQMNGGGISVDGFCAGGGHYLQRRDSPPWKGFLPGGGYSRDCYAGNKTQLHCKRCDKACRYHS